MSKISLYIHIGYPKTGTTTLQKIYFEKQNKIKYITPELSKEFYNLFYYSSTLIWKQNYKKYLNIIVNEQDLLFSTETITTISLVPSFINGGLISLIDPKIMIEKINDIKTTLNINVKIIVTIRKQDDILLSLYAQVKNRTFSKLYQMNTFKKYYNFIFVDKNYDYVEALNYNLLINEYEKLFKKENILVLVFEELNKNPEEYYNKLFEFLNISDNMLKDKLLTSKLNVKKSLKGYKSDRISLKTYFYPIKQKYFSNLKLNQCLKNILDNLYIGGNINKNICLDIEQRDIIKNYFEQDNKILSDKYQLELNKYGYYKEKSI